MRNGYLIGFAFVLALLLAPVSASAHTGLKSSVPANGSTVDRPPGEIVLEFNTDIGSMSTFEVLGENDKAWSVSSIRVDQNKMTGKLDASLPGGTYKVKWHIVGRDGHPVESELSFTVKREGQQSSAAQDAASAGTQAAQQPKEPAAAPPETGGNGRTIAVIAIAAAAVLALGIVVRLRRKRG
ncbi:copper resistance CopC family protein [Paenibacillus sp. GYB003]|uniref:copper resistance CopC family protein n=1 Tax=Paenibacillus sp. GYB003 TaxID=2994392 RepID=UPI002F96ABA6